ncbi:MAG: hypothetical protein KA146_13055, partial [Leptospiraceae bacterium]|nr:hypothetical protein [Leptospiraceae bacterium]
SKIKSLLAASSFDLYGRKVPMYTVLEVEPSARRLPNAKRRKRIIITLSVFKKNIVFTHYSFQ